MPVKVLLVASERWISTARLAMALIESGCGVSVVCRDLHPVLLIGGLGKRFAYRDLSPSRSLHAAFEDVSPDLVICCDEETFRLAHRMYERAVREGDGPTRDLLERSFGAPGYYRTAMSRFGLMALAAEEKIQIPESLQVDTLADLRVAEERLGWPLVLKSDGSFGGNGVRIAQNGVQARTYWRRLRGPADPLRTLNRVLTNKRLTPFYAMLRRQRDTVVAQRRIAGPEATLAAACWRGELLACHCMEVVESWRLRGPSSVLRVIDSEAMRAAARTLVRKLGLSGFCGFDFVLDAETGVPLLIEMNVRPTQTGHLRLGPGRDLVAALVHAVAREGEGSYRMAGESDRPWRTPVIREEFIALFPQEMQRDPKSKWLEAGFHDVPHTERLLAETAAKKPVLDWYGALKRVIGDTMQVRL